MARGVGRNGTVQAPLGSTNSYCLTEPLELLRTACLLSLNKGGYTQSTFKLSAAILIVHLEYKGL